MAAGRRVILVFAAKAGIEPRVVHRQLDAAGNGQMLVSPVEVAGGCQRSRPENPSDALAPAYELGHRNDGLTIAPREVNAAQFFF